MLIRFVESEYAVNVWQLLLERNDSFRKIRRFLTVSPLKLQVKFGCLTGVHFMVFGGEPQVASVQTWRKTIPGSERR